MNVKILRSRLSQGAAMSIGVLLAVGLGVLVFMPGPQHPGVSATRRSVPAAPIGPCAPRQHVSLSKLIGVAPGWHWQLATEKFAAATGTTPTIVETYQRFGQSFDPHLACSIERSSALPLIQLLPRFQPLTAIAAGKYDGYLRRFAGDVRKYRAKVILSFAHEMNGPWFPWGFHQSSPAAFVAAWRHIHDVFTKAGATNVIWLWNVNRKSPAVSGPAPYWPGARYVTWVGIDAYYETPTSTFSNTFNPTLTLIRRFTQAPVLITETAVPKSPHAYAQTQSLFAGVRANPQIIGFVWFDINRRELWKLEPDPGALAAFRAGVRSLGRKAT